MTKEEKKVYLEEVKNIMDDLITNEETESVSYEDYIKFMKQQSLEKYSLNNHLMLLAQLVINGENFLGVEFNGFKTWQKQGRIVKKGEAAYWIKAPVKIDKEEEKEENIFSEEVEEEGKKKKLYFRLIPVFELKQTEKIN